MKKQYMTPVLEVVRIETVSMLAASDPDTFSVKVNNTDTVDDGWGD